MYHGCWPCRCSAGLPAKASLPATAASRATNAAPAFSQDPEVRAFIVDMHEQHGFDVDPPDAQFAAIRPNATVLRAIRPPAVPEKQRSWQRYRERFVNSRASAAASRFWQTACRRPCNAPQRSTAYRPKSSWRSSASRPNTARTWAVSASSKRWLRWRSTTRHAPSSSAANSNNSCCWLAKTASARSTSKAPTPAPSASRSSCRAASVAFAVDFDGDDRIDLRGSNVDAIGSVARFLQQHGWQKGAPVAVPASVNGDPAMLHRRRYQTGADGARVGQPGVVRGRRRRCRPTGRR
jgi:membrane-bound lytic murein transglycosylase B